MSDVNPVNHQPPKGTAPPGPRVAKIPIVPEFARIADAMAATGMSRSGMYRLAATNPGLFRKLNRSTIVDMTLLRAITNALPVARIGAGKG